MVYTFIRLNGWLCVRNCKKTTDGATHPAPLHPRTTILWKNVTVKREELIVRRCTAVPRLPLLAFYALGLLSRLKRDVSRPACTEKACNGSCGCFYEKNPKRNAANGSHPTDDGNLFRKWVGAFLGLFVCVSASIVCRRQKETRLLRPSIFCICQWGM